MKKVLALMFLFPFVTRAEIAFTHAQGLLHTDARLLLGTRTVAIGFSSLRNERESLGAEAAYDFLSHTVEARTIFTRQLRESQYVTPSFSLGLTVVAVPEDLNFGIGPHAALGLSIGKPIFLIEMGLSAGAELFLNGVSKIPIRGQLGARFTYQNFSLALGFRTGADVIPHAFFVLRGEAILSIGWQL
jgi:hypothetical protein